MTHANAPRTPEGRRRLVALVVEHGWPLRRAADRFQCSPATVSKWVRRHRADLPLTDLSSRPHRMPQRADTHTERRIISLRANRRWGPHRIGYHLGIPRSTVGRVLNRYRMPLLAHLDQATGLPVRAAKPIRYEKSAPGELVHIDIKKLGRIPDHRQTERSSDSIGHSRLSGPTRPPTTPTKLARWTTRAGCTTTTITAPTRESAGRSLRLAFTTCRGTTTRRIQAGSASWASRTNFSCHGVSTAPRRYAVRAQATASSAATPSYRARMASAVPVRPLPPPQAISTLSIEDRS